MFSIENNYDQPARAFECFWMTKPTVEVLKDYMTDKLVIWNQVTMDHITSIHLGIETTVSGARYWLEYIPPLDSMEHKILD